MISKTSEEIGKEVEQGLGGLFSDCNAKKWIPFEEFEEEVKAVKVEFKLKDRAIELLNRQVSQLSKFETQRVKKYKEEVKEALNHWLKLNPKLNEVIQMELGIIVRKEKKCNHEFVYNKIINQLRGTISYVITCKKCFFEPPEGYVLDERTKSILSFSLKNKDFFDYLESKRKKP